MISNAATFMEAVQYANGTSAIVIQAFFAAAQLTGAYEGEQRDGNALISDREFRLARHGVWRWVYATRAVTPSKKQTVLWEILHSIEKSVVQASAKEIRQLALRIAGCVCALVRIVPSSNTLLTSKGIVCAPGATFYRFIEVHALATPVPVTYLRNATTGAPKWATRYLKFGIHVHASIAYKLACGALRARDMWLQSKHEQVLHASYARTRTHTVGNYKITVGILAASWRHLGGILKKGTIKSLSPFCRLTVPFSKKNSFFTHPATPTHPHTHPHTHTHTHIHTRTHTHTLGATNASRS